MILDVYSGVAVTGRHMGSVSPNGTMKGFQELGTYSILRPNQNSILYIDDSPIPTEPDVSFWEWSPGFYSGRVTVEVVSPDSFQPQVYFFDVSPDQNKTGDAQFMQFLEEIAQYLPEYLLGAEPAQAAIGGKSPLTNLWVSYVRFKANADAYLRAIQMVRDRPITRLKYLRERVDIHRAKRIDTVTIGALTSNSTLLEALAYGRRNERDDSSLVRDTLVNVPFHDLSVDNPPNQLMLKQINEISRQAAWLGSQLAQYHESGGDTSTDMRKSMPRRIHFLAKTERKLRLITTSEPFSNVSSQSARAAGLNAVSANPIYDRAHKLGLTILKKGVSELSSGEMQYLGTTWRLYEAWCFCVMASTLESTYSNYVWTLHRNKPHSDSLLEGSNGDSFIRLYDQLVCPSLGNANSYGYMSISRERRPDFVLEFENNSTREFVCIDAKYRVSRRGLLDAMASAHIYQNSLKLNGRPPKGSCLVAPHVKNVDALSEQDYWERYEVACFTLGKICDVKIFLPKIMERFSHWTSEDN